MGDTRAAILSHGFTDPDGAMLFEQALVTVTGDPGSAIFDADDCHREPPRSSARNEAPMTPTPSGLLTSKPTQMTWGGIWRAPRRPDDMGRRSYMI